MSKTVLRAYETIHGSVPAPEMLEWEVIKDVLVNWGDVADLRRKYLEEKVKEQKLKSEIRIN